MNEIQVDSKDGLASVMICNPVARNALTPEMVRELTRLFRRLDDDDTVKCVLLRGSGGHFIGGGDVKGFEATLAQSSMERYEAYEQKLLVGNRMISAIEDMKKPLVVSAQGAVAGAGLAICLAADFVIAARSSFFVCSHVHLGLSLDCGLSYLLPRNMNIKAAKEIALLGGRITSDAAVEQGIVTCCVEEDELEAKTAEYTDKILKLPGNALGHIKWLINHSYQTSRNEQLSAEVKAVAECAAHENFEIGVRAFIKKKRPDFT